MMIFDTINNYKNYRDFPTLYQALEYLSALQPCECPTETVKLSGDDLFANPVYLTSKPERECIYEAHKKYIDLHYIIEGIEGIQTSNLLSLKEVTPYDEIKDIGFYEGDEDGMYYLKEGQFMVCWPQDAHKVAIMKEKPDAIKKIVIKIKIKE